jgi:hypothetical protein
MRRRITQAVVRELLDCDPTTGVLRWRCRDRRWFKTDRSWASWNAKHAGREAFTALDSSGHKQGRLLGRRYAAHRLIFFWMTGRWPLIVDHIDHDRTNNKWENLRDVSAEENARNKARRSDNRSGQTGVRKSGTSWIAQIGSDYLGSFSDFDEAVAERLAEQAERGFSDTHGAPRENACV